MALARNSSASQGFIVYPGIIDEDLKGEIKTVTYVKREMHFNTGLLSCYCFPVSPMNKEICKLTQGQDCLVAVNDQLQMNDI